MFKALQLRIFNKQLAPIEAAVASVMQKPTVQSALAAWQNNPDAGTTDAQKVASFEQKLLAIHVIQQEVLHAPALASLPGATRTVLQKLLPMLLVDNNPTPEKIMEAVRNLFFLRDQVASFVTQWKKRQSPDSYTEYDVARQVLLGLREMITGNAKGNLYDSPERILTGEQNHFSMLEAYLRAPQPFSDRVQACGVGVCLPIAIMGHTVLELLKPMCHLNSAVVIGNECLPQKDGGAYFENHAKLQIMVPLQGEEGTQEIIPIVFDPSAVHSNLGHAVSLDPLKQALEELDPYVVTSSQELLGELFSNYLLDTRVNYIHLFYEDAGEKKRDVNPAVFAQILEKISINQEKVPIQLSHSFYAEAITVFSNAQQADQEGTVGTDNVWAQVMFPVFEKALPFYEANLQSALGSQVFSQYIEQLATFVNKYKHCDEQTTSRYEQLIGTIVSNALYGYHYPDDETKKTVLNNIYAYFGALFDANLQQEFKKAAKRTGTMGDVRQPRSRRVLKNVPLDTFLKE